MAAEEPGAPDRVFLVMGSDEEHGWVEAAYASQVTAEDHARHLQATADSKFDWYRVKEVVVRV